jgi:hypothetical protein
MRRLLLLGLVCVAVPFSAFATPYIPVDEMTPSQGSEELAPPYAPPAAPLRAPLAVESYDPLAQYALGAQFIVGLQVADTSSGAYGGMREAEHMMTVIQTDNTQESIWIWSHYYRLTGTDAYNANVAAAWEYVMSHKAYDEEGGDDPVTGYYRMYNTGWALRAVMEYSDVYGDGTYSSYGDSCASYICHHPMVLNFVTGAPRRLNGMIMSWALGNLYEYGQYTGDSLFMARALTIVDSVKTWVDANPARFHWKEWAMDGGVVMWGIVNSYFADDPTGLADWVTAGAPNLDTEVLPTAGDYQNAWRAWAALGQSTAWDALDNPTYQGYFQHLADTLVANDGDLDGGIPVLDADPDDYDQSWVTNYLGFMCMDRLCSQAGVAEPTVSGRGLNLSVAPSPSHGLPVLRFSMERQGSATVSVYDALGRLIASDRSESLPPGVHETALGSMARGPVAPGIYFCTVRSADRVERVKAVVLR